jgi:hypothetical protein
VSIQTTPEETSDIEKRINRLTVDDIISVSDVMGPRSIADSLADLFNDYLESSVSIRETLRDADYIDLIDRAVNNSKLERYLSAKLYPGEETRRIGQSDRTKCVQALCRLALEHEAPGTVDAALADLHANAPAFKAFSLTHSLWKAWPRLSRIHTFWLAAFLFHDEIGDSAKLILPDPTPPPMDLTGYQDLRTVVKHLLADQPGKTLFAKLMNVLPMDVLKTSSGAYRVASQKELADKKTNLWPGRPDKKALIAGTTLSHPADLALDAVLNSSAFIAWQNQLVEALEWYAPQEPDRASQSMNRQLAVQALVDCIYPIKQRRAGYLLDFHLFDPANANLSFYDLRIDLINSVSETLNCVNAEAQIVTQLLLTRFAPELLLTDDPEDFLYRPDLRWTNLRHALRLSPELPNTRSFAEWESLPAQLATQAIEPDLRLQLTMARTEAMIIWGVHAGVINDRQRYTPNELKRVMRHFESAWDRHALNALPDRLGAARRSLENAGINPDSTNTRDGTKTELESYLDEGTGYRPMIASNVSLPNATQVFDQAFDRYLVDARQTFTELIKLFFNELPALDHERLMSGKLACYAVEWFQYVGEVTGGVPEYASSPEQDWQACRAGHGCMVHVVHEDQHFLYQLFPESNALRVQTMKTESENWLDGADLFLAGINRLIEPNYALYNGEPLPHDKASWPRLKRLPAVPGADNAQQLTETMVESVFLYHADSLRAVCKGTTQMETQARVRQATSDATYAWHLIKSVIPAVGCFDAHTGTDAATCVADVVGDVGTVVTVAGRTLKPLIKLAGKARPRANDLLTLLSPRKQNAKWFADRTIARRQFEQQVFASGDVIASGKYASNRGMFQPLADNDLTRTATQRAVTVDGVDNVLVHNVSTADYADYRWLNPNDLKPYGPRLSAVDSTDASVARRFASTQTRLLPGQFPGAVQLNEVSEHGYDLSVTADRNIRVVRRDATVTDLIIDEVTYRFDDALESGVLRKVELDLPEARLSSLDEMPVPCRVKRGITEDSCAGALTLLSSPIAVSEPSHGEHASHAFMTRRFRPAIKRSTRRGQTRPQETHLLVDDGKICTWIDETLPGRDGLGTQKTGKKILAAVADEQARHLGLATPPQYRTVVSGRVMKDQTLGLPDDFTGTWRDYINRELPVVQLDSICKTINDQRELRGVRVKLDGEHCLAIEADTGQFYKAPAQLNDGPLQFTRMTSNSDIDEYLNISEAYRLGTSRRTLSRDMKNIARMMLEIEGPTLDLETVYPMFASGLESYARAILTDAVALDRFVKITRSIIPDFKQMADVDPIIRQHVAGVLNVLLPATGAKQPWLRVPANDLSLMATGDQIRRHINSTNLAFLLAETSDNKHYVYYALAGGKRGKNLTLRSPVTKDQSSTTFVDAREYMKDQTPDPQFTSLPVIRTAEKLSIREHDRYLDAERLIATAFKQDMRLDTKLTKIHFFTLMDTCNSCGGFVMPRLKLDFPSAEFSVSYILPYTPPT